MTKREEAERELQQLRANSSDMEHDEFVRRESDLLDSMASLTKRRKVQVGGDDGYTRTVKHVTHTIICAHCGKEKTIEQYPGATPKYCSKPCRKAVQRAQARDRKRIQRQRQAASRRANSLTKPLL